MKVLLSGYYGFDNAGDEAVLFSILQALREKNITDITVLSAQPEKTEKLYGVRAANRWLKPELLKEISRCDVLISGGGSLLQDVTSKNGILYYLGIIALAKLLRKKVMIYAQGIGPVNHKRNRILTKAILNGVNAITVRDADSRQELLKMGVQRDIVVSSDPVLGVSSDMVDGLQGLKILQMEEAYQSDKETIMIAARNWDNSEKIFSEIASACDRFIEENYQVVLVPFHDPEDRVAGEAIAKMMRQKPVVLTENYTPMETMAILKNADIIIGMRLHSLIMGFSLQKSLVGISYDPKVTSFMQKIRQDSCFDVTALQAAALYDAVIDVKHNREAYLSLWKELQPIMEKQAKEPAEMLLKI